MIMPEVYFSFVFLTVGFYRHYLFTVPRQKFLQRFLSDAVPAVILLINIHRIIMT